MEFMNIFVKLTSIPLYNSEADDLVFNFQDYNINSLPC